MTQDRILTGGRLLVVLLGVGLLIANLPPSQGDPTRGDLNHPLCAGHTIGCDGELLDSIVTTGVYALFVPQDVTEVGNEVGDAIVEIRESLWQSAVGGPEWKPVNDVNTGSEVAISDGGDGSWVEVTDAIQAGHRVVVGVGSGGEYGSYSLVWAVDVTDLAFVSPGLWEQTGHLQAFASWEGNPINSNSSENESADLERLLVSWNVEVNVFPPSAYNLTGPIQLSFNRFVDEVLYPAVAWGELPAEKRNLQDAPTDLIEDLVETEVWFYVPDSWLAFQNGAICLRVADLGSNGCIHVNSLEGGHLLVLDALVPSGSEMVIEARPLEGAGPDPVPAWGGGIRIGTIPYSDVAVTGSVLVQLSAALAPSSYAQLSDAPAPLVRAASSPLSAQTLEGLLDLEPHAVPDSCGLACT